MAKRSVRDADSLEDASNIVHRVKRLHVGEANGSSDDRGGSPLSVHVPLCTPEPQPDSSPLHQTIQNTREAHPFQESALHMLPADVEQRSNHHLMYSQQHSNPQPVTRRTDFELSHDSAPNIDPIEAETTDVHAVYAHVNSMLRALHFSRLNRNQTQF
mmetsp:Transcript_9940/g.20885  ORF Transcript_9940/g.20885 Transcript_9940/m.20885 type:complete len:158 (+) Transcript_9940:69-542(+)